MKHEILLSVTILSAQQSKQTQDIDVVIWSQRGQ